ncbi:DNA gyrase subunit A [Natronobacterium gregoryi]|uniref:DNA gyrase subunit A n=2 Tax=Natronobacterium gregoryi TaxID=44930 RepID=L0AC50_NATGS|nr:DNA gyrase subunit A [Natronobacterium gregoryi]AFZ71446.1 DNA gyrase, A subunit [Natronobacterium gregoryi SP2]ELY66748.1 DNA gyrase subunit A [Natronobacterium gregoryi SP2]PLK19960.1 DNA gyrase subunit A [Natronobacterium gregoryi SP2]SFJ36020.1 DNA gyrase subunit A [Natronobacterium gregoryi]
MSSEVPDPTDVEARAVENVRIEDEMEQSYIDYAMSVIAGRALPRVEDGLKPVHRRILYAMHEMGVTSGSSHRKSSSIVGETMGDYHPHGDSAIYDTLVRMAQDFSMRYPLVDGQGNFGSMDGDPAAAQRYTEARMSPISEELLEDIDKDTVDFSSNYDDRLQEPDVLPAAFPNLLVNGSSGIAVGMSTNIPPHNLGEVIDATIELIDDPEATVEDLMEHVKGPDFPTGANIVGRDAIYSAYKTGRGRIRVRAEFEVEEWKNGRERIVITELPFQANKARMVERIAEDVTEGKIEGISDLRDESDRDGVRIVVELNRGANTEVVKNKLLENHLERTFGVINLALVDGQPQVLSLKETLEEYVAHRREVVRRRSEYDLAEAEDRAHILEGRLKAVENAEDVVEVIRDSETRADAKAALQEAYGFSQDQADHIVRMQLGSLTSMEAAEIEDEYEDVQAEIERLTTILDSEQELLEVIKDELRKVKDEYDDERRTSIVEDEGTVTHEDLIPEEEVVVVMTEDDYVKRMPIETFDPQGRGGKGIIGADVKDEDRVATVFRANTHDYLLCFTNQGNVYQLKTYEIPEMGRTARGKSAVNILDLDDGEDITAIVDTDALEGDEFVTMATRNGYVKRTASEEFDNIRSTGIIAADLEEGDELVDVEVTDGSQDLVIATEGGMTIRFAEDEVRAMGRTARGVNGIKLQADDAVAGLVAANGDDGDGQALLTVTRNGYGKRTPIEEYSTQSRYGKGLIDIKTEGRNGPVTAIKAVSEDDHLVLMSEDGQIVRTRVDEVSTVGRNTMGVIVMQVEGDDAVASVDEIPAATIATDEAEADDSN